LNRQLKERRKYPRLETEIVLRGMPEDGDSEALLVTENLSLGGVCCTSTIDIPEMTCLAVQMTLPATDTGDRAETIEVEAVVVRREVASSASRHFKLALLFTFLDERATDLLANYLAGLSEKQQ
jgi:hypothetical protein